VISLLPSATEIVCALGCDDRLVGRSHECDYPEHVRRLPACTAAQIDPVATSAEIDRQVKARLEQALSLYRIDMGAIRDLRPDVILTQAQCEVCAVSLPEVQRAVADWTGSPARAVSLSPQHFSDLWQNINTVAELLDVRERGRELVKGLKSRVADFIAKTASLTKRPSVACIEWFEPLMAAGNWVPELVELAGGLNLFGEAGKHSPWLNWEAVQEHDPEIIVAMPCGFDLDRTQREFPALYKRPDWSKLRAVRNRQVYLVDGNQYFNRPGPRLVDSLELLAGLIHPRLFHFAGLRNAWRDG
jgi:iron complex transport system substrate-binding protein